MVLDFSGLRKKKVNRKLSFRRRCGYNHNLTSNDQIKLVKIQRITCFLAVLIKKHPKVCKYKKMQTFYLFQSTILSYSKDINFNRVNNNSRTILSFGTTCKSNFRFESDDLQMLLVELKFPRVVKFENKMKMLGEEVFIRGET